MPVILNSAGPEKLRTYEAQVADILKSEFFQYFLQYILWKRRERHGRSLGGSQIRPCSDMKNGI